MASPASLGFSDSDLWTNRSTSTANPAKLSFAERKALASRADGSSIAEGDSTMMREVTRALPGDVVQRARKPQSADVVKKRSSFFEDAFSTKDNSAAKERVQSEAIVMAEVRTNVIINDEFTFITELSYHLSARYQRPVSSIIVTVQHGACMLFGGTFEPAYAMTVFALPSQMMPITNRRNAALIQKHMEEALGVSPARGFLRFVPMTEEHVACNGKTMASEIDDLEKSLGGQSLDENGSIMSRKSKARGRLSVKSLGNFRAVQSAPVPLPKPTSACAPGTNPPVPPLPTMFGSMQTSTILPQKEKAAKRRKSFVSTIFGRSARVENPPANAGTLHHGARQT